MAYNQDPFAGLIRQRPLQVQGQSDPVSRDQLEERRKRLEAFGLDGTGLDRMNDSAMKVMDWKDGAKTAVRDSMIQGVLGEAGKAALTQGAAKSMLGTAAGAAL